MSESLYVGSVVLGHYRIVRPIARGGMGIIYLARNEGAAGFVRPVVVKRIAGDLVGDKAFVRLFVREARVLAYLRHPGIVGILDFAEEHGAYLMILEYVHGYSLRLWSRYLLETRGAFPADVAVEIMASVLEALHYAHTLSSPDGEPLHIVHRDISPANVLIDVDGHVKLADFGIARTQLDRTEASANLELKGKMAYMAPELLQLKEPSPSSDIFSCGVTLHEILTGKNELNQGDPVSTATYVLSHDLTPVNQVRRELPESLAKVISKAVARDPAQRFETAVELAQALRAVKDQLPQSGPLAAIAKRDFRDPRFTELLGVTDLDALSHAWQQEKTSSPAEPPATSHAEQEKAQSDTIPPPVPARAVSRSTMIVAAMVLAVVAAAAIVVLGQRRDRGPATRFVLVEGNATPYEDGQEVRPEPDRPRIDGGSAPAAPQPEPSRPGSDDAGAKAPVRRVDPVLELSRAFASRRGMVARCVEQNAEEAQAAPEVAIRFRVAADGSVTSVELVPASAAGTRAGACILGVARATHFPPQREPVSFRIPVTFRRR
ncbi:MAG: protein kinase [Deltaproteobacteria bacterium]|nr:protein kinase [Deltaproteobacteria bacterium]